MKLKFTSREIEAIVVKHYPYTTAKVLSVATGLSVGRVYRMADKLGVKKSPEFRAEQLRDEAKKLREAGKAHRFKKGHKTHNKGKKMPPEVYEKVKRTMFKKGHKPPNTKHDGHISIRKDKSGREYAHIRVRKGEYKLLHRVVWEENNGPIPKGYIVAFKSKNTMDITLDNLELITRKENMARNTIQRYPEELISAIKLNAKVNKHIKKQTEPNNYGTE